MGVGVRAARKRRWRETHKSVVEAQQMLRTMSDPHPDTYLTPLTDEEQQVWDALLNRLK